MVSDASTAAALRALLRVREIAHQATTLEDLLEQVATTTCTTLGYSTVAVNVDRPDHGDLMVAAVCGSSKAVVALKDTVTTWETWAPILSGRFELAASVFFVAAGEYDFDDSMPAHVPVMDVSADRRAWHPDDVLVAVLRGSNGRPLGLLSVDEPGSGKRPTVQDAEILAAVADHIAHAIDQHRRAQRERLRTRALEGLARLGTDMFAAAGIDEALALVVAAVSSTLDIHEVEIACVVDGDQLQTRAAQGPARMNKSALSAWPLYRTAADTARLPGMDTHEAAGQILLNLNDTGSAAPVGILRAALREGEHWADDVLIPMLEAFASQAGAAIRSQALRVERDRERDVARRDPVTGIPNRLAVEEALRDADRADSAVLNVRLDDLAPVADSLGHAAAEQLLRAVADRLVAGAGTQAFVGRIAGEEFAVLCGADQAAALGRSIFDDLSAATSLGTVDIYLQVSVGIALADPLADADVLRRARMATTQARSLRQPVAMYDASRDRSRRRLALTAALHRAIDEEEFELHYQPLYDLQDGEMLGLEALLRWRHDGQMIPPGDFIALAESSGLIEPIGAWVVHEACRQAGAWTAQGLEVPVVGVNVSPRQLKRGDLMSTVSGALQQHAVPPERLCVEITESALFGDEQLMVELVAELEATGVRCAIDDFGSRHSSLARLAELPVGLVKLDRQFLAQVPEDPRATQVLEAILTMAGHLGLSTVVEGIETAAQAQFCTNAGADIGQGFLLGRPADAQRTASLLAERLHAPLPVTFS